MRTFTFTKDEEGFWFVVLPEWEGAPEDLQMVSGADTMLDIFSKGKDQVRLKISTEEFEESTHLELIKLLDPGMGGDYLLRTHQGNYLGLHIWLCGVTEFVFNEIPENLYIKVV